MQESDSKSPTEPVTEGAVRSLWVRAEAQYPVKGGLLFGSRARGDFLSDSDADVAALFVAPVRKAFPQTSATG